METSPFDRLARLFGKATGRRTAFVAATGSLAALTQSVADAQPTSQNGNVAGTCRQRCRGARGLRGLRGPQGKQGKQGKQGNPGTSLGAGIVIANQQCTENPVPADLGAQRSCVATCPNGYVATGGGYELGSLFESLAIVRSTGPNPLNGSPTGWSVGIQFIDVGQQVDYTARALCAPA